MISPEHKKNVYIFRDLIEKETCEELNHGISVNDKLKCHWDENS